MSQEEMEERTWDAEIASWNGLVSEEKANELWEELKEEYPNSNLLKRKFRKD